jgi:trigger factor
MQVSVESGEGLERRMRVELPSEQIDAEVEKRLKKIARNVKMDGFRPGKVPLSIVRQRYAGQVHQEVFGDLVQQSFFEAVGQEKLSPAGEPRIEPLAEAGSAGYTAVFEVMPEFEVGQLETISVKRPNVDIGDADVDQMIEKLRKQRVTWNPVERPATEGDQVRVSFQGRLEGEEEPFEGGSAENFSLEIGADRMIEGFEGGLIGASAGDNRELALHFPEQYQVETLAGKPVTFSVQVHEVAEPVLPEVDEAFAASLGVTEGGVEAMRSEIRANMQRELDQKVQAVIKQQVLDGVLAANAIDVPKVMVDKEVRELQERARQEVGASGRSKGMELPASLFEDQARRRVALGLIISKVISANQMKADPKRVRQMIEAHASSYEDPQQVIDWYQGNREQLTALEAVALEDQVVDWVLERAQVADEETSFEALMGNMA